MDKQANISGPDPEALMQQETPEERLLPWFEEEGLERLPSSRPVRRPGQYLRVYGVPRVYLDDIETIHHILSKQSKAIRMQTEEFRIRHPRQLTLLPQERIMEFRFLTMEPEIRVELGRNGHSVITASDEPQVNEVAEEIVDTISRRRVKVVSFFMSGRNLLLLMIPMVLSYAGVLMMRRTLKVEIAVLTAGMFTPILAMFLGGLLMSNRTGVVIPMRKKDVPKAWYVTNEMKIALATAIVTAVVTAIATVLVLSP